MKINPAGLALIKEFEGLRLRAYRDAVGIPTIGYGSTGAHVHMGLTITEQEAEDLLKRDLARFEQGVTQAVGAIPTTSNQFSAMVCLAFNIGLGAFGRSSVLRFHRQSRPTLAAGAFLLWVKAGGKTLRGLIRRRNAERRLYLS